jgi:predicted outer membrane repeat protein
MPATTTFQGNTAQTVGGGLINVFCTLEIVTTPEGTIKAINVAADTLGDWTISRCGEIFKE